MKAVIIGSGIGGLCAGIRLIKRGYSVEIFEKLGVAGGVTSEYHSKNNQFRFDNTASIVIDPQEYDQIFLDVGLNPRDYFEFMELDTLYQVFFENGMQYSLYRDIEKQREQFEFFFQRPLDEYIHFVQEYALNYILADHSFLTQPFCRVGEVFNVKTFRQALRLKPFYTANKAIERYIENKEFQNFLLFQCLYMGISPYVLNNIYVMIPAVSQEKGILHIKGGMTTYTKALLQAFLDFGGVIHYKSPVDEIEVSNQIAAGIRVNNRSVKADLVVSDADYFETEANLLHRCVFPSGLIRKRYNKFDMSCSVFMLRLGLSCKYDHLSVHNVYINQNFRKEVERVFSGFLPISPPAYIYYPAAVDAHFGDKAHSSMNIMIRVPNLSFQNIKWDELTTQTMKKQCLKILRHVTRDENLENKIQYEDFVTPFDLKNRYLCHEGAAFGIGHTLMQSIMFRPQAKSPQIKNLYFVGSSTHPGNGVTMVMKGAEIAVNLIDHAN